MWASIIRPPNPKRTETILSNKQKVVKRLLDLSFRAFSEHLLCKRPGNCWAGLDSSLVFRVRIPPNQHGTQRETLRRLMSLSQLTFHPCSSEIKWQSRVHGLGLSINPRRGTPAEDREKRQAYLPAAAPFYQKLTESRKPHQKTITMV